MVKKEVINTGFPKAGPYSLGIKAGDLIFISGQVPNSDDKNIKNQTLTVLGKIKAVHRAGIIFVLRRRRSSFGPGT